MERSPGELFERTFSAAATDRLVRCLRRAYGTACEHHVPESGSNEVTFGINLYFHAVHEICEEARREPDLLDVTSRQPIFRFRSGPFELACHRVGLSERESIWTSFPKNEGAACLMVEEQLWLPGIDLAPRFDLGSARKLILAHLGNADEGMRAVYLCIPGRTEGGRITGWVFARPLFRADEAARERPAARPALLPEVTVEAPVVTRKRPPPPEVVAEQLVLTRKPKKSPHEAAG
jgi:hypothetical protein